MTEISVFKTKLEEALAKIVAELSSIGEYNSETDDWKAKPDQESGGLEADANTNADAVESWNERRATLSDLEIEYQDIKRALAKIEAGTYGICEISGESIEEKRLIARPDARTCIAHMDEESSLSL